MAPSKGKRRKVKKAVKVPNTGPKKLLDTNLLDFFNRKPGHPRKKPGNIATLPEQVNISKKNKAPSKMTKKMTSKKNEPLAIAAINKKSKPKNWSSPENLALLQNSVNHWTKKCGDALDSNGESINLKIGIN